MLKFIAFTVKTVEAIGKKSCLLYREISIAQGRSAEALADFAAKIKRSKCKIESVAVDMAPSYTAWCQEHLPDATIVYDHFHVIKLANEKLDLVRRNEVNKVKEVDKSQKE